MQRVNVLEPLPSLFYATSDVKIETLFDNDSDYSKVFCSWELR